MSKESQEVNPFKDPYSEEYVQEYKNLVEKAADKIWNMTDGELMEELKHLLHYHYHNYENIESDRDPIEYIKGEFSL